MFLLQKISKTYDNGFTALSGVSLELPDRGLVAITGESGSGKSTLLNIISGLDFCTEGSISFNGLELRHSIINEFRRNNVSNIFQDYQLLNGLNVESNIKLAREIIGKSISPEECNSLLKEVGMEGTGKKKLSQLSGGEMQRVAIARALAKESAVICADEPTGNLDSKNSRNIFEILKKLSKEILVVVVTHNESLAEEFADLTLKMQDGQIQESVVKNIPQAKPSNRKAEKTKFTFATAFKLSKWSGMKKVSTSLFAFFSIVLLTASMLSVAFLSMDRYSLAAKTIDGNKNKIAAFSYKNPSGKLMLGGEDIEELAEYGLSGANFVSKDIDYRDNNYLKEDDGYFDIVFSEVIIFRYVIEANDIDKIGLRLIAGENASNDSDVLLPSVFADEIIKRGYYLTGRTTISDGQQIAEKVAVSTYQELLGADFCHMHYSVPLKIKGIYESAPKYDGKYSDLSNEEVYKLSKPEKAEAEAALIDYGYSLDRFSLIVNKSFFSNMLKNHDLDLGKYHGYFYDLGIVNESGIFLGSYSKSLYKAEYDKYISTQSADKNLGKNEIYVSTQCFNRLSSQGHIKDGYVTFTPVRRNGYNERLAEQIYKIKGTFSTNDIYLGEVLMPQEDYAACMPEAVYDGISVSLNGVNVKTQIKSFAKAGKELFSEDTEQTVIANRLTGLDDVSETVDTLKPKLFIPLFVVVSLLVMLFSYLTININIDLKKHDIGVLRALGANKTNITSVFSLSSMMFTLLQSVIALILSFIIVFLLNLLLQSLFMCSLQLLSLGAAEILTGLALVVATNFLTLMLKISLIFKKPIIKTIKDDK